MTRDLTKTNEMFQRALKTIPYGVNSNFRYWGDKDTIVVARGDGGVMWDQDENRYIDYRLAFGPVILGHSYPPVNEAVAKALKDGNLFAWTTPYEIEAAELVKELTGVDKVRLGNTGTEVTMHALRIARAYTGRERFIKFEGQYHGMHDYVMFSTAGTPAGMLGSRRSPINVQTTSGIPEGIRQYVINLPFNDPERLEETIEAHWHEIACLFVEPMMGNSAGIMPKKGYLKKMRQLCDKYGIVLVFDEVKTGFRIANGGAQEYFDIKADLTTYAKAMGNGFPVAAIGGTEEVMGVIGPGSVAHGGTYTGNVVGAAAAVATLKILRDEPIIETIFKRGQRLMEGIGKILADEGIPNYVTGVPSMFSYILGVDEEPQDFRAYAKGDDGLYERLSFALLDRGVMPDVDGREPWFMCYAHDDAIIDETLNAFADAVKAVK
jgi:glutamate-1-semialdehyde 2,1-aminomutase